MSGSDYDKLSAEFNAFRVRSEKNKKMAYLQGKEDALKNMLDLIDDFDRALELIKKTPEQQATYSGVTKLKERVIKHFDSAGFFIFGEEGEMFDPNIHEAIANIPGDGIDGSIAKVHRRGWKRQDGRIIKPALVSVLKGTKITDISQITGKNPNTQNILFHLDSETKEQKIRRTKRPSKTPENYLCPYGVEGCKADCPGCSPISLDDLISEEEIISKEEQELLIESEILPYPKEETENIKLKNGILPPPSKVENSTQEISQEKQNKEKTNQQEKDISIEELVDKLSQQIQKDKQKTAEKTTQTQNEQFSPEKEYLHKLDEYFEEKQETENKEENTPKNKHYAKNNVDEETKQGDNK